MDVGSLGSHIWKVSHLVVVVFILGRIPVRSFFARRAMNKDSDLPADVRSCQKRLCASDLQTLYGRFRSLEQSPTQNHKIIRSPWGLKA